FVFFYYLKMLDKQKKALLDMKLHEQAELYRSELATRIEAAISENRKLKHDLKNHFIMLESTIKVDDELALEYLHDIMGKM
ncbi:ATP-binding protein, partial [Erysipelatoclostridium ramosum]|nr:ATP-binding protein [Thomasclavelia ramosa]